MFEVGWCVALYLTVLAVEFSPVVFEWLGWSKILRWAKKLTLATAVFGVMLSTLHQSTLGALFLLTPDKLHPFWYSPFIPIFFFISSIAAGLSMVIFESSLSHRTFAHQIDHTNHASHDRLTLGLGKAAAVVLFAYFCLRVIGVADGGHWDLLGTKYGGLFLLEVLGFVLLPMVMYVRGVKTANVRSVRIAAVLTVLGIIVNRLNVAIFAFNWQLSDRYFPHWMEIAVTITIVTVGVLTFRWIVNRMPVLYDHPDYAVTE